MSSLKDLSKSIPQALLNQQATYEVMQRTQRAYNKRMQVLGRESNVFAECRPTRPHKAKCVQHVQRSGKQSFVTGIRVGAYTTIACRHSEY